MLKKYLLDGLPPIFYRENTSDQIILQHNLGDNPEYQFPQHADPSVIMDVGANIGIVAVAMANLYPKAKIHCYEPDPENFEILKMNVKEYEQIEANGCALGAFTGERSLFESDDPSNFGGRSFFEPGTSQKVCGIVPIKKTSEEIDRIGGHADLIKIDAEGSEFEVLSSMTEYQRQKTMFIFGELHGTKDYETLALLEREFHLAFQKPLDSRVWQFYAQRKAK